MKTKKIDFVYNYLEYEIRLKCKCKNEIIISGDDDWRGNICPKCKRKYQFQLNGKVKEIKGKNDKRNRNKPIK